MQYPQANLLLISASKADNTPYLSHAQNWLLDHFDKREVLFIPYAGVGMAHSDYTQRVATAMQAVGTKVRGIEAYADPRQAIANAEAIAVGGGNTYMLLDTLYRLGLIDPIRRKIAAGTPYAGWSAGSNIAGRSIRTTNDMPIIQPPSFTALNLVPFQLNPHYTDFVPAGFHGETRDQRLQEFMALDPHTPVLAIREGSALQIKDQQMYLLGHKDGYVFRDGCKLKLQAGANCSQWL